MMSCEYSYIYQHRVESNNMEAEKAEAFRCRNQIAEDVAGGLLICVASSEWKTFQVVRL